MTLWQRLLVGIAIALPVVIMLGALLLVAGADLSCCVEAQR